MQIGVRVRDVAIVALMLLCAPAWVAAQEFEPNDSCDTAQIEPVVGLPLVRRGELAARGGTQDVDFFRFEATPGTVIQVDVEGAPSSAGALVDPFVGLFDARCDLIASDNDGGDDLNARLVIFVPDHGVLNIGVTRCCDYNFEGGGNGSYRITLKKREPIGGIYGEGVDADTGESLSGYMSPPGLLALLFSCEGQHCNDHVSSMSADENGIFLFTVDHAGRPLLDGDYQVELLTSGYEQFRTETFTAEPHGITDLGTLRLTPLVFVGTITGQLRDGIDDSPLASAPPAWPYVILYACEEEYCAQVIGEETDEAGRFRIDGRNAQIQPGRFRVTAYAMGYEPVESEEFFLGPEQHVDIGELRLTPFPLRLGYTHVCDLVAGNICHFGMEISARTAERLSLEAWGMISFVNPDAPVYNSRFQIGRKGLVNPTPQSLSLAPGETRILRFYFQMPRNLDEASVLCANILIGQAPNALFNPLVDHWAFCVQQRNGELAQLSAKESLKIFRAERFGVKEPRARTPGKERVEVVQEHEDENR